MTEYSETTIQGELTTIKKVYNGHKGENINFVIERHGKEGRPTHQYIVSAFTKNEHGQDRFGIHHLIGEQVEAQCYVNGRTRDTPKGEFHIIDLNLKSIVKLNPQAHD